MVSKLKFYRTYLKSKRISPCINASTPNRSAFVSKALAVFGMAKISIGNRLHFTSCADSSYEYRIYRNFMKYSGEALLSSVEKVSHSGEHYR